MWASGRAVPGSAGPTDRIRAQQLGQGPDPRVATRQVPSVGPLLTGQNEQFSPMARDPKARRITLSYSGGTVTAALGLIQYIFGTTNPTWGGGTTATTPSGRRRYKYGTRQKANAAAGKQVFVDLGEQGVYSVRVTGDVVDFVEKAVAASSNRIKMIWTKRGSVYGPTLPVD